MKALIDWLLSLFRPRPAALPPADPPPPPPRPSIVTAELLVRAVGCSPTVAEVFAPHLDETCHLYGIDTPVRLAAFLAQVGHESGSLVYVREVWGPTPAQAGYEGRADLGNTEPGDGSLFRGRGLIQVTGRGNYRAVRDRMRARFGWDLIPDFEAYPKALEQPRWAALSAGDYWASCSLNDLADANNHYAFQQVTKRINGGLNGLADRLLRWDRAKRALGV